MVFETICPYCHRAFDIDYLEMCFAFSRWHPFWSHECPMCGHSLRLKRQWEVPVMLVSLVVALALSCSLFPHFEFLCVIAAIGFDYLISGLFRYFFVRSCGLV